jgi:membrane protease YdiL (CAAX protease family)
MLKYQIIQDIFVLCAVFSVIGMLLYWVTRSGVEPEDEEERLGPLDLLGAGTIFLLYFYFHHASAQAAGSGVDNEITPLLIVMSMAVQVVISGAVLAFLAPRVELIGHLGLRWPGWRWIALIAPAGVVGTWLVAWVVDLSAYTEWVENLLNERAVQSSVTALQESRDPVLLGLMGVAVVVVAPVTEELIFRGYLFPVLRRFTGVSFAAVMSGLIFAVAHGELGALPILFFLGVLLALVYQRSGSIWAPIGVHALFNLMTVLASIAMRVAPNVPG